MQPRTTRWLAPALLFAPAGYPHLPFMAKKPTLHALARAAKVSPATVSRVVAITGIVAGSDQVAAGVYSALRELDITIPDDVSVVGINDTQGAFLSPELTGVREFPEELGLHLAEFVLKRIQSPLHPPRNSRFPRRPCTARLSRRPPGRSASPSSRRASDKHSGNSRFPQRRRRRSRRLRSP